MKILIVDDRKENLYMLESLLKGHGHEVASAKNGAEALEKLRANGFDMIISDILMPVMDGFQLCHEVRSDSKLKTTPFAFYTATYTDKGDEELAYKVRADKYIRKPIEPDEFMKIIDGVIEDAKKGRIKPKKPSVKEGKDAFKLYNERLVRKLEKKTLDMEEANKALRESEEKYRDLYDNAPDMYHTLDKNGIIINCNETEAKMLGYKKKEEIIGRPLTDFFTDESKRLFEKDFPWSSKKRRRLNIEREFVRKDGTTFPAILNVFAELDEGGKLIETKTISRNITERKAAEEQIRALKEFNENIVQSLQEPIVIEDANGYITFANPKAQETLGYEDELIGKHWTVIVPEDYHDVGNVKRRELSGGAKATYESVLKSPEKDEINVLVSSSPQFDAGNFTGVISSYTDVTEYKEREDETRESRLKYEVRKGESYLIKEKELGEALHIFEDLLQNGFNGFVISRTYPPKIKDRCKVDVPVLWLTTEETVEESIRPEFHILEDAVRGRVVRNSVLLIERLDYLVMHNGFKETVKFIQRIAEFMLSRKGILILQIDDATLTEQEQSILEKEAGHPNRRTTLPEELLSVLDFVRKQSSMGNNPSFTDINKAFNVTENTTRKRVRELQAMGLVGEVKRGRYKLLELTEKGKRWF